MNKDYKNIDELVSQNLHPFEMDFDSDDWAEMETMLDEQPKGFWQQFDKNKGLHLLAIGFLGTLTCCWAWWFFVQQPMANTIQKAPAVQQAIISAPSFSKSTEAIVSPKIELENKADKNSGSKETKFSNPTDAILNTSEVNGKKLVEPKAENHNSAFVSTETKTNSEQQVLPKSQSSKISPKIEQTSTVTGQSSAQSTTEEVMPALENNNKINSTSDTQEKLDQKPNKIKSSSEYESEVVWLERTPDNANAGILTRNQSTVNPISPYFNQIPSITEPTFEGGLASADMPTLGKKRWFKLSVKGIAGVNMNFTDNIGQVNKSLQTEALMVDNADANATSSRQWSSGTTFGLGANVGIGNHWSVETALIRTKRNYISRDVISPDYIWGEVAGIEYDIDAWEIPLLVQYDFGRKSVRPFIAVGPSVYRLRNEQYVFHSSAPTSDQFLNDYSGSSASRFQSTELSRSPENNTTSLDSPSFNNETQSSSEYGTALLPTGDVRKFLGVVFNVKTGMNWRVCEKQTLSLNALYQTTLNKKRFELALSDHEIQNFKHLQSLGLELAWSYRIK